MLRGIEALEVNGVRIGPLAFLQPNPDVAERMYDALVDGMYGGRVFDLYMGSGATTGRLKKLAEDVLPRESHPEAARSLGMEAETADVFLARQSGDFGAAAASTGADSDNGVWTGGACKGPGRPRGGLASFRRAVTDAARRAAKLVRR